MVSQSLPLEGSELPSSYLHGSNDLAGFRGQPVFQSLYISAVTALGGLTAYVSRTEKFHHSFSAIAETENVHSFFFSLVQTVLSPGRKTAAQIWHRTLTFIGLGLSAVFPVAHMLMSKGLERARTEGGIDYLAAGGACYIFGAILYAARIPEKLSPGRFDLIGSSHQIFHFFVLAGSYCHYLSIRHAAKL